MAVGKDEDYYARLPEVEEELLEILREQFQPHELKPGDKIEDAMYSAGQQSVITWLEQAREIQLERQNAYEP